MGYSPWCYKELDMTEGLNNNNMGIRRQTDIQMFSIKIISLNLLSLQLFQNNKRLKYLLHFYFFFVDADGLKPMLLKYSY